MKKIAILATAGALALSVSTAQAFFPGTGYPGGFPGYTSSAFPHYGGFPGYGGMPTFADMFGFGDIDTYFRSSSYGRGSGYTQPYGYTYPYGYSNPYSNVYGYPYAYGAVPYGTAPVMPVVPQEESAE